jgi:hypothetical protein
MEFGDRFTGSVDDRHVSGSGIFGDGSSNDIDDRRTLTVAVPRHSTAGRDFMATHAKTAIGDRGGFFRDVDGR